MGALLRIFGRASPEQREAVSKAAERVPPNSFDPSTDDPVRLVVNSRRIKVRNMDEIIGMCRMILADGAVEDAEARLLLESLESSLYATSDWPGNILHARLMQAMTDGRIDPEEEKELLEVINQVAGGRPQPGGPSVSGAIPFDNPMPEIVYEGRGFVLTGQFAFGPRKRVSSVIEERGGVVKDGCSGKTNYLIVGTFGSEEWLHSTHGTKILKAIELRQEGKPLAIVAEQAWVATL